MASLPSLTLSLSLSDLRPKPTSLSSPYFQSPSTGALVLPLLRNPPSFSFQAPIRRRFHPNPPRLPQISCSQSPPDPEPSSNPPLLRRCAEGAALLLVGSLLFLGTLSRKPALALGNAQRSNFSSPMKEKTVETLEEGGEEGEEEEHDDHEEMEMYERLLEQNPSDVEALKVVLFANMRKGKMREALRYVERLITVEPDEVEWRLLRALTYEVMGKLSKAKKLFMEILKERPLLLRALHGLALAMHKNHEGPAVFDMLNKALDLARQENRVPEERNIKILIAQMYVVKGDLDGAAKRFQDLATEDPRDFRPYLCQGIIYGLLDKKKEADEQFEIYRSLVPDEFPQRGFIDDVILSAKTESRERLEKEFKSEFSYKK